MMMKNDNPLGLELGFCFHPSDLELVGHYLYNKIKRPAGGGGPTIADYLIREFDVYSTEPWNLPYDSFLYQDEDKNMHFFTPRHPTAKESKKASRIAGCGVWQGNSKDVPIMDGNRAIGHKTQLTFNIFEGKDKKKKKTDWIMHEFKLACPSNSARFDDMVLCRIHLKKNGQVPLAVSIADLAGQLLAEDEEEECRERPLKRQRQTAIETELQLILRQSAADAEDMERSCYRTDDNTEATCCHPPSLSNTADDWSFYQTHDNIKATSCNPPSSSAADEWSCYRTDNTEETCYHPLSSTTANEWSCCRIDNDTEATCCHPPSSSSTANERSYHLTDNNTEATSCHPSSSGAITDGMFCLDDFCSLPPLDAELGAVFCSSSSLSPVDPLLGSADFTADWSFDPEGISYGEEMSSFPLLNGFLPEDASTVPPPTFDNVECCK